MCYKGLQVLDKFEKLEFENQKLEIMKKVLMLCAVLLLSAPMIVLASPLPAAVSSSVSTANDVDDLLTQLEKVIEEYALIVPKVKTGDTEATMQLANLSIKMSKLAESLADSKDEMTEQQLARYVAVISKMAAALI